MKSKSIRKQFVDCILESSTIPNGTITHHYEPNRGFDADIRIKFKSESGVTDLETLTKVLTPLGISDIRLAAKASGAKIDQNNGFLINWKNEKFVILIKGMVKDDEVRRKQTSPSKLNLSGKEYDSAIELYNDVTNQINNAQLSSDIKKTLIDLLTAVFDDTTFSVTSSLTTSNFIQSDFGEILAALYRAKQKDKIIFPINNNNSGFDFIGNQSKYSVKAPNGDHFNLRDYKNQITGTTPVDLFFKACTTSDYTLLLESLSFDDGICKDLYSWVKQIVKSPKITTNEIKQFMKVISYEDFLLWVKSRQDNKNEIGIPKKLNAAKDCWNRQDINPFIWTYITLAQKVWGSTHIKEISKFAKKLLKKDETIFITVNINIDNQRIEFTEQLISDVGSWGIWYLGYCTGAVKNWPGIHRIKENK